MTVRKKYLLQEFKVGGLLYGDDYANRVPENWINEQQQFYGDLLGTIPTGDLSAAATSIPAVFADPALAPRRALRIGYELMPITAVAIAYTITRAQNGTARAAHVINTPLINADGQQAAVLSAALGGGSTDLTMNTGPVDLAIVNTFLEMRTIITLDDEDVLVTTIAATVTVTRGTGAVAHVAPHIVTDENGPYSLEHLWGADGLLYIAMVDAN